MHIPKCTFQGTKSPLNARAHPLPTTHTHTHTHTTHTTHAHTTHTHCRLLSSVHETHTLTHTHTHPHTTHTMHTHTHAPTPQTVLDCSVYAIPGVVGGVAIVDSIIADPDNEHYAGDYL